LVDLLVPQDHEALQARQAAQLVPQVPLVYKESQVPPVAVQLDHKVPQAQPEVLVVISQPMSTVKATVSATWPQLQLAT
jgi:hypothetical protein